MESKIRVKVGSIEVEYEGTQEYIKNGLQDLLETLLSALPEDQFEEKIESIEPLPETTDPSAKKIEMTTNTIAMRLNVKSASDLIIAACAHLTFVKGAATYTRGNILAEIKEANNYFKKSYTNNLSKSLGSLVKSDKLIERSKDTYSLSSSEKSRLEKELGIK